MIQRYAFTSLFLLLIIAFTVSTATAESYTYRSGGGITTLRGLPLDLSHFNTRANGYIPHEGGNDFIIMEQFDKNCGPNSAQMVLYYYRNHKRLKEVWALGDIHTVYHPYWSDVEGIEISGEDKFFGKTHRWEERLTFSNPLDIVQVSDIELLSSTGTARLNGWERVGDRTIKLWGDIEDGAFVRGRMWVVVRTFYLDESAAAPSGQSMLQSDSLIETSLLPNYPNPFNPETWIPYQLAKPADVSVSIYAADGKLVRTLALGRISAGVYQSKSRAAYWDGNNTQGEPVASGLYFYTFKAGEFSAIRKMLIRK